MGPLSGIRVLDLSRILAGPYCSMILGDMGAEIIKVEIPGTGDDTRGYGPPFINGESAYFMSINRNKKSLTLDLKKPEAAEILSGLIMKSDVLLENFRVGTMEKLGFGSDRVMEMNKRMIFASISGFGSTGPAAKKPGYDLVIQGLGGLMSITGFPETGPAKVGTSICDIISGIMAAQGILLALYHREKSGEGQKVDISMLDSIISLLTYQAGIYFADGTVPGLSGNRHPTIAPYETFKTKNGLMNIAVGNDKIWKMFCECIQRPDLASDPVFEKNAGRVGNYSRLKPVIDSELSGKDTSEWMEIFEKSGVPAGRINSIKDVFEDGQVNSRGMVVDINHKKAGPIKLTGIPVKLSKTPGAVNLPPPVLGEHTEDVLKSVLGYSREKINELRSNKII